MSANARPNLNGLFNGTTKPDRSSTIADALGPRSSAEAPATASPTSSAADEDDASTVVSEVEDRGRPGRASTPAAPAAKSHGTGQLNGRVDAPAIEANGPTDRRHLPAALPWIDPVRAVDRYFEVLQAVLDTNRDVARRLAGVVNSISRPGRLRL
jgi:hypothetical protein